MTKRILLVFETSWDRPQLAGCRAAWDSRYEVVFAEPSDDDVAWDLDIPAYVAEQCERLRGSIDGVFSLSDYPGATAAGAIATGLGLAGTRPQIVLRASHKYYSRLLQREVVPEAVPDFTLVDPDRPETLDDVPRYPCFIKPVKGAFSVMSGVIGSRAELDAFVFSERCDWFRSEYLAIFARLVEHFDIDQPGRAFVAEGILRGEQATVEGWCSETGEGILGIVDSGFRPGTRSFVRFDYPSALPADVQRRMGEVALRVARHVGLRETLFNVEMIWDPQTDGFGIVEINPRGCGQFADLYAKVDGRSSYEVALALAAGEPVPEARGRGAYRAAASFPLRVFRPVRVTRVPDAARLRAIERANAGTLVWLECDAGDELTDFKTLEDGESARYGIVNLGGASRADLDARLAAVLADLDVGMEPVQRQP